MAESPQEATKTATEKSELNKTLSGTFRIAVVFLGLATLITIIAATWVIYLGKDPSVIVPIATAAVGGLAGLLSQPGKA